MSIFKEEYFRSFLLQLLVLAAMSISFVSCIVLPKGPVLDAIFLIFGAACIMSDTDSLIESSEYFEGFCEKRKIEKELKALK